MDGLAQLRSALAGRYEIERELGRGGMAVVYAARDARHDRQVAIKALRPDLTATIMRDRFLREIRLAAGLSHPNILAVYDSGEVGDVLYYVMPIVLGVSLRERLDRDGRLSLDEAIRITKQVGDALSYAHARNIVHRDIKPENILLSATQEATGAGSVSAHVADFGIARALSAAREIGLTATGVSIGTPAYMSPEQAFGDQVDARTDVFALGCVLYEMLGGEPAFGLSARVAIRRHTPTPLTKLRPDVPRELEAVTTRAMAEEVNDRYQTVEQFVAAVDRAATASGALGTMTSARWRRVSYVAAALALFGVFFALTRPWRWMGHPRAITAQGEATKHVPTDTVRRLYERGVAEQRRRTVDGTREALTLLDRAIALDSGFSMAWAAIARTAQFASGRKWPIPGRSLDSLLSLAVHASRRAIQLDSSSAETWVVAARVAQAVDPADRTATLHAINRALLLDSMDVNAWFELGLAREELLQPARAESAWLRASTINPTDLQVLAFLGFHYLWSDDFDRGVPFADSAVTLDPTFVLAREAAAQLALALKRPNDAVRHAEAQLRAPRGSELALPLAVLARAALQRGDRALARRHLVHADSTIERDSPSKHEAAYIGAAWAAYGDTMRALRWLSAYQPRGDLHFQLHLKRDPGLRWLASTKSPLLIP